LSNIAIAARSGRMNMLEDFTTPERNMRPSRIGNLAVIAHVLAHLKLKEDLAAPGAKMGGCHKEFRF